MKTLLYIVGMLIFLPGCHKAEVNAPSESDDPDTVNYKVVAYLPTWKMPYNPQWDKITHLCLAFGTVKADGQLDLAPVEQNRYIIRQAQNNKVKVLLSIGGGGSQNFSTAILNETTRNVLIQRLNQAVENLQLDGIDVDYEEWEGSPTGASPADLQKQAALENLYRELRNTLGKDKLITAAVTASWDNGQWGFYNCINASMHQYLDFVSLMIYDETGPWSGTNVGQHASMPFFENAIRFWLETKKLPKNKLVAGVPFYGYKFLSSGNATGAEGIAYKDILSLYPNAHLTDNVDLIYYNGIHTIRKKAEFIDQNQLGGIMIWELTQDSPDVTKSLLNVIHEAWKN